MRRAPYVTALARLLQRCNAAFSLFCVREGLASYHPQRALAGSGLQRNFASPIAAVTS